MDVLHLDSLALCCFVSPVWDRVGVRKRERRHSCVVVVVLRPWCVLGVTERDFEFVLALFHAE